MPNPHAPQGAAARPEPRRDQFGVPWCTSSCPHFLGYFECALTLRPVMPGDEAQHALGEDTSERGGACEPAARADAAELAAVRKALSDATFEVRDVAGPIAHRIRMYREAWQRDYEKLEAELAAVKRERAALLKHQSADSALIVALRAEVEAWRDAAEMEARDSRFPGDDEDKPTQVELSVARMRGVVAARTGQRHILGTPTDHNPA